MTIPLFYTENLPSFHEYSGIFWIFQNIHGMMEDFLYRMMECFTFIYSIHDHCRSVNERENEHSYSLHHSIQKIFHHLFTFTFIYSIRDHCLYVSAYDRIVMYRIFHHLFTFTFIYSMHDHYLYVSAYDGIVMYRMDSV